MQGLGDNVYQRPFVRAAAARGRVSVETPWPELYADLGVSFVRPTTKLRTQAKNADRQPDARWGDPVGDELVFRYGSEHLEHGSIVQAMEMVLPLDGAPFVFDLPDFGPSPVKAERPVAVVRPATVRSEWPAPARNPRPDYIADAAAHLQAAGFHVVSVADLEDGAEWLVGDAPPADTVLHAGELEFPALMALVQNAAVCVGGVGWIAPAAIAAGVPLVLIAGGQAAFNAPEHVTDPRMDLSRVRWIIPERYCRCKDRKHECDKGISDFGDKFAAALRGVTA